MNNDPNDSDDRDTYAKAIDKASQIFSACLMMVLPCVGGFFLDKYLTTHLVFTLLGLVFGFAAGIVQMIKIVNPRPS